MTTPGGLSWQGGWDEPGVLSVVIVESGQPGTGVFVYSGVPASGNPPIGWISAAATDPYGNTITPASDVVIGAGQDGSPQVVLESSSGSGEIAFPLPGTWTNYPNIFGSLSGSGGLLSINGPTDSTIDDQVFVSLASAAVEGSGSTGFLAYIDANAGRNTIAEWSFNGLTVNVGSVTAVEPGTGTSATNPAVGESWHAMTLANSWANVAGFATARYRLTALDQVEVIGAIDASSASSAVFFTLPSGYRPASQQAVCAMGASGSVPAGLSPWVRCTTGGALSVQNTGALGAWEAFFHGFISLDA